MEVFSPQEETQLEARFNGGHDVLPISISKHGEMSVCIMVDTFIRASQPPEITHFMVIICPIQINKIGKV